MHVLNYCMSMSSSGYYANEHVTSYTNLNHIKTGNDKTIFVVRRVSLC